VARGAQLRTMRLHRIDIGAVQQPLIRIGIVGFDQFDEFELPHHRAAAPILLCPNPVMAQPVYGPTTLLPCRRAIGSRPSGQATRREGSSDEQGPSSAPAPGAASCAGTRLPYSVVCWS